MADPNYWLPLIAAGGTVVAAIISGFLAASLKHHWDVAADQLRWQRERAERRREELKSAFTRYLTSRSSIERATFFAARDRTLAAVEAVWHLQAEYLHSLAELQTILEDRSFLAMEGEIISFSNWLQERNAGLEGEEITWRPAPDHQSIVHLAQKLIRD